MDSHLIYTVSSYLKRKANWNEWIYCGVGDDIKEDIVSNAINKYFQDSILFYVSTRKESSEINKQDIVERIKKDLPQYELYLWDTTFKKAIEFNKIGVMRIGLVPTRL